MVQFLLSYVLVAFGQPVWSSVLSFLAATVGYALFFSETIDSKKKFILGTFWYTLVEWTWLIWFISHPYMYIYFVHLGLSLLAGIQFGLFTTLVTRERLKSLQGLLFLSGFWVLMEWLRFFFLAGFFWNPAGLALTANHISIQFASIGGVLFLTFWVIMSNLLALRFALFKKGLTQTLIAFLLPFLYGSLQLAYYQKAVDSSSKFNAVLVQTAFDPEEEGNFKTVESLKTFVLHEWKSIFATLQPHLGKPIDLMVLPEGTVTFGTYSFVFKKAQVEEFFSSVFGEEALLSLAHLTLPFAAHYNGEWLVSNAYIAKSLANLFSSHLVIGLEDAEFAPQTKERLYFTSAQVFSPLSEEITRYDKRVLVPMGEYIPFSFCAPFAKAYGIASSFTRGQEVKIIPHEKTPFGLSICYEEMYGDLMRENRVFGANLLVNITNDAWYPHSTLTKQHYHHSRLRTVETGIPLLRACNTGYTCATDCLGRLVGAIDGEGFEDKQEALYVSVPTTHFKTLYALLGDGMMVGFSLMLVLLEKNRIK